LAAVYVSGRFQLFTYVLYTVCKFCFCMSHRVVKSNHELAKFNFGISLDLAI
jgi:hypothetical protein